MSSLKYLYFECHVKAVLYFLIIHIKNVNFFQSHLNLMSWLGGIFYFDVVVSIMFSPIIPSSERTWLGNCKESQPSVSHRTKSTKWKTQLIQLSYWSVGKLNSNVPPNNWLSYPKLTSVWSIIPLIVLLYSVQLHSWVQINCLQKWFPSERRSTNTKDNLVSWRRV